jgi:hypothetical protein
MAANVGGKSVGGGGGAAGVGGTAGGGGGAAVCRASGSRWTPTPEQIRILKELYYGCGIRSPNSEQIQRITAMLRQHGKIEGKNVFYWFQNHKARERQKRRLTNLDINVPAAPADADADACHHGGALSLSSPSSGTCVRAAFALFARARSSGTRVVCKLLTVGRVRVCMSASNRRSPAGAPPPLLSPLVGLYPGNGGGSALQLDTSSDCWGSTTAMATTETCFLQVRSNCACTPPTHTSIDTFVPPGPIRVAATLLILTVHAQDYMGVMRSTGGHHGSSTGAAAPSPWACFTSPDSWAAAAAAAAAGAPTTTTTTRAPETLPLFPTGDNVQPPRPRHGAPAAGDAIRGVGSGYLPTTLPFWGAAATAAAATTTTTSVTIQQQHHQLLQLQDQYSFYTTTNSQPPSSHDASSAAAASLELSLSSWCSPYPAGTM